MARYLKGLAVLLFWLLVWQVASLAVGNPILLCGPVDVVVTLAYDVVSASFWSSVAYSFSRIAIGFFGAFSIGMILGAVAWRAHGFATLFNPAVQFIKSVPIACFIVLLLIWFGSTYVSAIAVFLVAFPAFYFSMIEGLSMQDTLIKEMLAVFRVPFTRRVLVFHWQTVLPFLVATSRIAVGMSWKAGVAAELIGLSIGSIGEHIYQAKIGLSSADLFAWTIAIVALSMLCERFFLMLLRRSGGWAWSLALLRKEGKNKSGTQEESFGGVSKVHDLIHIVDASKSFGDEEVVVRPPSMVIASGDGLALRGPSGAGKTTMLRLLAGLAKPDTGTVESDARASMVFQEARLFENRNAIDNVSLAVGNSMDSADIERWLHKLLPSNALDKPVSQLSGGMRRRVELVRALAAESDIVFLDEPFAGLDEKAQRFARCFVIEHLQGRTLVIASHDEQDIEALGIDNIITVGA